MRDDKDAKEFLKKALYVIEDNLRPGNPEYEEDRTKFAAIVDRDRAYIQEEKLDERRQIIELERLEKEIKKSLG